MILTNLNFKKYASEEEGGATANVFPEIAAAALPFIYYGFKKRKAGLEAAQAISNIAKTKLAPQVEKALTGGVLKIIDDRIKLEAHVDQMLPELKNFPGLKRQFVNTLDQQILSADNAAFMAPRKPGMDPAIILSGAKKNTVIEAHEVGHFLDFQNSGAKTNKEFHKIFRPIWSRVRTAFGGSAQNAPYYKGEARAWDLGGISPDDITRQKALRTYEVSLQSNRAPVLATTLAGGTYLVHKPLDEDNIE